MKPFSDLYIQIERLCLDFVTNAIIDADYFFLSESSSKLLSPDEFIGLVSPTTDENQAGRDQGAHSEASDSTAAQSGELPQPL